MNDITTNLSDSFSAKERREIVREILDTDNEGYKLCKEVYYKIFNLRKSNIASQIRRMFVMNSVNFVLGALGILVSILLV